MAFVMSISETEERTNSRTLSGAWDVLARAASAREGLFRSEACAMGSGDCTICQMSTLKEAAYCCILVCGQRLSAHQGRPPANLGAWCGVGLAVAEGHRVLQGWADGALRAQRL